jgi:hypothetical protein
MSKKHGLVVCTGREGAYCTAKIPAPCDDALLSQSRIARHNIGIPEVMRFTNDDRVAATVATEYYRSQVAFQPSTTFATEPRVNSFEYVNTSNDFGTKHAMVAFMDPLYNNAWSPVISHNNEVQTIKGRIVDVKPKNPASVTDHMQQMMDDFVECLFPEPYVLRPIDDDDIYERMIKPAQKLQLDQANDGANYVDLIKMFIKKEAYGKPTDPRPISTMHNEIKLKYSRYMYACADYVKESHWYAFGHTPREISDLLCAKLIGAEFSLDSDFSRFDGHVSEALRMLEQKMTLRAFVPVYHTELLDLQKRQYNQNAISTQGVWYNSGFSRASGSHETSIFNTIANAFIAYVGFRYTSHNGVQLGKFQAWHKLGLYAGDDGFSPDLPDHVLVKAAKLLGQVATTTVTHRGKFGVTFLARVYGPDVWCGDTNSCCDLPRTLGKFHTTVNVGPVDAAVKLIEKARSMVQCDGNTPIIGCFLKRVLLVSDGIDIKLTEAVRAAITDGKVQWPSESQYKNDSADWMLAYANDSLRGPDHQRLQEWLETCDKVDDLLHPPLIVASNEDIKIPQHVLVNGDFPYQKGHDLTIRNGYENIHPDVANLAFHKAKSDKASKNGTVMMNSSDGGRLKKPFGRYDDPQQARYAGQKSMRYVAPALRDTTNGTICPIKPVVKPYSPTDSDGRANLLPWVSAKRRALDNVSDNNIDNFRSGRYKICKYHVTQGDHDTDHCRKFKKLVAEAKEAGELHKVNNTPDDGSSPQSHGCDARMRSDHEKLNTTLTDMPRFTESHPLAKHCPMDPKFQRLKPFQNLIAHKLRVEDECLETPEEKRTEYQHDLWQKLNHPNADRDRRRDISLLRPHTSRGLGYDVAEGTQPYTPGASLPNQSYSRIKQSKLANDEQRKRNRGFELVGIETNPGPNTGKKNNNKSMVKKTLKGGVLAKREGTRTSLERGRKNRRSAALAESSMPTFAPAAIGAVVTTSEFAQSAGAAQKIADQDNTGSVRCTGVAVMTSACTAYTTNTGVSYHGAFGTAAAPDVGTALLHPEYIDPRLGSVAENYEYYAFRKLNVTYVPFVGTQTAGGVYLGISKDPSQSIADFLQVGTAASSATATQELMDIPNSKATSSWQAAACNIIHTGTELWKTFVGGDPVVETIQAVLCGIIEATQTSGTLNLYGHFRVDYVCDFYNPIAPETSISSQVYPMPDFTTVSNGFTFNDTAFVTSTNSGVTNSFFCGNLLFGRTSEYQNVPADLPIIVFANLMIGGWTGNGTVSLILFNESANTLVIGPQTWVYTSSSNPAIISLTAQWTLEADQHYGIGIKFPAALTGTTMSGYVTGLFSAPTYYLTQSGDSDPID